MLWYLKRPSVCRSDKPYHKNFNNNFVNANNIKQKKCCLKRHLKERYVHESDSAAFNAYIVWTRCCIWCTHWKIHNPKKKRTVKCQILSSLLSIKLLIFSNWDLKNCFGMYEIFMWNAYIIFLVNISICLIKRV